ncbi:MAG: uroporphyrinogen decarboxylase family protein [Bacteroidetes bacterium]|nr:uroporphyrinogen decarboxylase family protein [Bacteroidota bacterium]MCL5027051.1 uroporphyrinogen decarboxylase family protein [Chloroflexota bacterium]
MTTYKQRIMAAFRGEPVDFVPWCPRWELWYDAAKLDGRLPEKYKDWDIYDVARDFGMGLRPRRGAPNAYKLVRRNVEIVTRQDGYFTHTEYRTPIGTATTLYQITPELESQGVRGRMVKDMIREKKDYDVVQYIVENTEVVPTPDDLAGLEKRIGDDGIVFVSALNSPMHTFMREYSGYEQAYLEVADHWPLVERLLQALRAQADEITRICLDSPAEIIACDGNYDRMLTPPNWFRQFFLPYLKEFAEKVHARGRLFQSHIDGENRGLIDLILESGIDIGEALAPAPLTSVAMKEFHHAFGQQIAIWGGIPTTVARASVRDADFEAYVIQTLKDCAPGNKLVLGTGDNFPTDANIEKVKMVAGIVEKYGKYPIQAS